MRYRPHTLSPEISTVRLLICYSAKRPAHISHIGLGVSALNTSQVLHAAGFWSDVLGISDAADLAYKLKIIQQDSVRDNIVPVSHVCIFAPFIPTQPLSAIVSTFSSVQFAVSSHSNVGFLSVDPNGVALFREGLDIQQAWKNFVMAANSQKFRIWVKKAYMREVTYLPNLYNLAHTINVPPRPLHQGGVLRIGSFGALRVLKNQMSAAAAAIEIATRLGLDTEFHMNSNRDEHAGTVRKSIAQLTANIQNFKLVLDPWDSWPQFRRVIRGMNLLLQPSFTESFNMCTADGVAEGVPSVTSDAIEWVPDNWQAKADDALDIANKGIGLLYDPQAALNGWDALERHNDDGITAWKKWLL